MRKIPVLLFFISCFIVSNSQENSLQKVVKKLYRVNPFGMSYSTFIKTIMNDPDVADKKITYKSDTGLYKFQGAFKKYNPFDLKFNQLRVQVIESPVHYIENKPAIDTVMGYCMIGSLNDNDESRKEADQYLNKITRQYKKYFKETDNVVFTNEKDGKLGRETNFFNDNSVFSPFTIGWEWKSGTGYVLFYTIARLKYLDNRVVEPIYRYSH